MVHLGGGGGGVGSRVRAPKLKQPTSETCKNINTVNLKCNVFITKLSLYCSIKLKRFLHKQQIHFCFTNIFLNINCLLRIACTIPVTSADNKGEKGTALKLVKGYHHDNRKTVRLGYDEHSLRKAH